MMPMQNNLAQRVGGVGMTPGLPNGGMPNGAPAQPMQNNLARPVMRLGGRPMQPVQGQPTQGQPIQQAQSLQQAQPQGTAQLPQNNLRARLGMM